MNCIARVRSLRGAPPIIATEELEAWRDALGQCNAALEIVRRGESDGLQVMTSWKPNDDLVPAIERVRSCLSAITPGGALPPTLFDLADVAWAQLETGMP
jgi:hypothetical protein